MNKEEKATSSVEQAIASAEATRLASIAATNAASVSKDIEYIKKDISEIKQAIKELTGVYVTQIEFRTVRSIVYGLVTLILVAVVGALVNVVVNRV